MKGRQLALLTQARTYRSMAALALLAAALPLAPDGRDEWQQPERVIADLALKPGAAVADIGCGSGYFTFPIARAVGATGKVFAVDIDEKAVKEVEERAGRQGAPHVRAIHSEPTDTKLAAASVDVALLCDVLHHVPRDQRLPLVRDIVRALKPAGYLFIIDWRKSRDVPFDPYEVLIPRDDLLKLAEDAGLSLDAEFHYLKYQVFLRFRKPPKP